MGKCMDTWKKSYSDTNWFQFVLQPEHLNIWTLLYAGPVNDVEHRRKFYLEAFCFHSGNTLCI